MGGRQLILIGLLVLGWAGLSMGQTLELETPSPYLENISDSLGIHHQVIPQNKTSGLPLSLDVWTPRNPGEYPVYLFLTGLNGVAPPFGYVQTFAKIAERGIIVIAPFVGFVGPQSSGRVSLEFIQSIYWLKRHLSLELKKAGLQSDIRAHWDQLIASGHSSSVKTMMDFYKSYKNHLAALVLIDPVNSYPFQKDGGTVQQDEFFDDGIPLLILASGFGRKSGRNLGGLWPPCAPDGISGTYFYDHFAGPKYYMEALQYGHADMLEGVYLDMLRASRFCYSSVEMDPQGFRTWIAGALASFVRTVVLKREEYRPYLENPGTILQQTRVMMHR